MPAIILCDCKSYLSLLHFILLLETTVIDSVCVCVCEGDTMEKHEKGLQVLPMITRISLAKPDPSVCSPLLILAVEPAELWFDPRDILREREKQA